MLLTAHAQKCTRILAKKAEMPVTILHGRFRIPDLPGMSSATNAKLQRSSQFLIFNF
jgi:hypothetical protein